MLKGEYKYHCEVPIYCFERYLILLWNDDAFDELKIIAQTNDLYDQWHDDGTGCISDIPVEEFIINSLKELGFEFDYICVDADTGNE